MELDECLCPQWEQWNSLYSVFRTSSDPDHRTSLLHFAIIQPQTVAPAQVFDSTFWKTVLNKFHTARPVTKPQNYFFPSQRPTVISSSLQWSSCALLSERSRRNALAQEPETSWIPECGALQESPESPTWTCSRFPWQRRTNRRKHWGNPVILQHWAIINTQSGEGSRSW